ncbi:MAG TPA: LysR family transcriptional regulator [Candidatus Baltobacteraceae bacterium]|nr:LysR family transcriptional regulator [Candidatus Baltobacteraceae bacterium]
MKITFAQLEALGQVARTGSFTKAARALHVTQPAVTQQIASLQRALGIRLVAIVGNRPQLTEAGRFVATRAEAVATELDALVTQTREWGNAERGTLHIAATLTIGSYVLPELLARFRTQHPHVVTRVEVINTAAVAARVRDGEVTVGLVEGPVNDAALVTEPFHHDRLALVVPTHGHRFSELSTVTAAELDGEAFVSREIGSGTRDLGYELLIARGIAPRLVVELPSGEAIVRAVEAGLGIAILSERVVERAIAVKAVRTLTISDLVMERAFSLVHLRDGVLPPLGHAFADHVRGAYQKEHAR